MSACVLWYTRHVTHVDKSWRVWKRRITHVFSLGVLDISSALVWVRSVMPWMWMSHGTSERVTTLVFSISLFGVMTVKYRVRGIFECLKIWYQEDCVYAPSLIMSSLIMCVMTVKYCVKWESITSVRYLKEVLYRYEWVTSHILRNLTHMNEFVWCNEWLTFELCHTCVNKACHTNEWVTSHVWTSQVNERGYQKYYVVLEKKVCRFSDCAGTKVPKTLRYKLFHSAVFKKSDCARMKCANQQTIDCFTISNKEEHNK